MITKTFESVLWSPLLPHISSKYEFVSGKCSKNKGKVFKNRYKSIFKSVCSHSLELVTMEKPFLCLFYLLCRLHFKFCPNAICLCFWGAPNPRRSLIFRCPFPDKGAQRLLLEGRAVCFSSLVVGITCGSACCQRGGRRVCGVFWKNRCGYLSGELMAALTAITQWWSICTVLLLESFLQLNNAFNCSSIVSWPWAWVRSTCCSSCNANHSCKILSHDRHF